MNSEDKCKQLLTRPAAIIYSRGVFLSHAHVPPNKHWGRVNLARQMEHFLTPSVYLTGKSSCHARLEKCHKNKNDSFFKSKNKNVCNCIVFMWDIYLYSSSVMSSQELLVIPGLFLFPSKHVEGASERQRSLTSKVFFWWESANRGLILTPL